MQLAFDSARRSLSAQEHDVAKRPQLTAVDQSQHRAAADRAPKGFGPPRGRGPTDWSQPQEDLENRADTDPEVLVRSLLPPDIAPRDWCLVPIYAGERHIRLRIHVWVEAELRSRAIPVVLNNRHCSSLVHYAHQELQEIEESTGFADCSAQVARLQELVELLSDYNANRSLPEDVTLVERPVDPPGLVRDADETRSRAASVDDLRFVASAGGTHLVRQLFDEPQLYDVLDWNVHAIAADQSGGSFRVSVCLVDGTEVQLGPYRTSSSKAAGLKDHIKRTIERPPYGSLEEIEKRGVLTLSLARAWETVRALSALAGKPQFLEPPVILDDLVKKLRATKSNRTEISRRYASGIPAVLLAHCDRIASADVLAILDCVKLNGWRAAFYKALIDAANDPTLNQVPAKERERVVGLLTENLELWLTERFGVQASAIAQSADDAKRSHDLKPRRQLSPAKLPKKPLFQNRADAKQKPIDFLAQTYGELDKRPPPKALLHSDRALYGALSVWLSRNKSAGKTPTTFAEILPPNLDVSPQEAVEIVQRRRESDRDRMRKRRAREHKPK